MTQTDNEEILALVLAWVYVVLMTVVLVQLARIVYFRHRMWSFQGAFLSICFFWTLLRVIFWFFVRLDRWPVWLSDLLYVLPTVCECATFSLLILFYAKLVNQQRWKASSVLYDNNKSNDEYRANLITVYGLANSTMLALTIMFAGIHNNRRQNEDSAASKEFLDRIYFVSSGVYFGVLSVLALYYISRLFSLSSLTVEVRRSMKTVFITSLVFVIFLSRSIFDILSALRVINVMHVYQTQRQGTRKVLSPTAFACFLLWEAVPTAMVLVYFSSIPSTRVAMCAGLRFHVRKFMSRWFSGVAIDDDDGDLDYGGRRYRYDTEDTISPVLRKIRVYSNLEPEEEDNTRESQARSSRLPSRSQPIYNAGNGTNNVFDNPHRYSLSPGDETWSDRTLYGSSYNNSYTPQKVRAVERLSSHYDMTPQHNYPSPV